MSCTAPSPGSKYCSVCLCRDGNKGRFAVHKLVALCWIGPLPFERAQVLHSNDLEEDNCVLNLSYGTQKKNMEDKERNGNGNKGSKHGMSILTEERVSKIKDRIRAKEPYSSIASSEGCSKATIGLIAVGKTWKHIL